METPTRRRSLLLATAAACLPAWHPGARAQSEPFPSRPVRIVVPFAPGGIADIMARVTGKAVGDSLGQPVVIENKPGAGTTIGTEQVVRSRADGYTLLLTSAPIATNPGLYPKLGYDALKDLTPVIWLGGDGFVIAVNEKQPYKSFADLVATARKPGTEIPYASPGSGTLMHLAGQLLNAEYQTHFLHVPYKGSGPALQDAMAGQVPMIIDPQSTIIGPIRQGRLRPLAVTSPQRLSLLPDVPTLRELGFPKAESVAFSGIMAPAGTPPAVIARLNAEFNKALQQPDVRKRLVDDLGGNYRGGTVEDFGNLVRTETERWVPLIKRLGLTAE